MEGLVVDKRKSQTQMKNSKDNNKIRIRILFFIGYLGIGGKERRMVELLGYLKKTGKYELLVVTTREGVELPKFLGLNIQMIVLKSSFMSKFNYFCSIYKKIRGFNPDIIHVWGRMQALYVLPSALITKTKIVNGQITSAPPKVSSIDSLIDKLNFRFSDIILSNSKAGIRVFNPPIRKTQVIYNGIDLNRFENLPDISLVKKKYRIHTQYLVLMVANFTHNKDYEMFFRLGKILTEQRKDLTWMGVGHFVEGSGLIQNCRNIIGDSPFMRIQSEISEVEALVNACDIGILLSNTAVHGEGISNAVIEYMALGKPVVANDAGGTKEVVIHDKTGYLIQNESLDQVAELIAMMLGQLDLRSSLGQNGRALIECGFSLDKMGSEFDSLYEKQISGEQQRV